MWEGGFGDIRIRNKGNKIELLVLNGSFNHVSHMEGRVG